MKSSEMPAAKTAAMPLVTKKMKKMAKKPSTGATTWPVKSAGK